MAAVTQDNVDTIATARDQAILLSGKAQEIHVLLQRIYSKVRLDHDENVGTDWDTQILATYKAGYDDLVDELRGMAESLPGGTP